MSAHDPEIGPPEFRQPPPTGELTPALHHLLRGGTLDAEQSAAAFEAIMSGRAHHGEIGALLALLSARVPTADEILGAARVMRRHADPVKSRRDPARIVDTAGTGGAPKTFNVSTAAALIAAGAGNGAIAVAKHGNRSRTGRGSAEVLRGLGVNVDADRAVQARCLDEAGICFCFAIHHHPAAKHAMPVRQALGFPTIFNLLGPLTNPAGARRQLMGVYDRRFMEPIAGALTTLGALRAMVVHSDDGLDEISVSPTRTASSPGTWTTRWRWSAVSWRAPRRARPAAWRFSTPRQPSWSPAPSSRSRTASPGPRPRSIRAQRSKPSRSSPNSRTLDGHDNSQGQVSRPL
ncbi:MAG: anthranilate phosphoribosyltransferase [Planctomycetota bacterium]